MKKVIIKKEYKTANINNFAIYHKIIICSSLVLLGLTLSIIQKKFSKECVFDNSGQIIGDYYDLFTENILNSLRSNFGITGVLIDFLFQLFEKPKDYKSSRPELIFFGILFIFGSLVADYYISSLNLGLFGACFFTSIKSLIFISGILLISYGTDALLDHVKKKYKNAKNELYLILIYSIVSILALSLQQYISLYLPDYSNLFLINALAAISISLGISVGIRAIIDSSFKDKFSKLREYRKICDRIDSDMTDKKKMYCYLALFLSLTILLSSIAFFLDIKGCWLLNSLGVGQFYSHIINSILFSVFLTFAIWVSTEANNSLFNIYKINIYEKHKEVNTLEDKSDKILTQEKNILMFKYIIISLLIIVSAILPIFIFSDILFNQDGLVGTPLFALELSPLYITISIAFVTILIGYLKNTYIDIENHNFILNEYPFERALFEYEAK